MRAVTLAGRSGKPGKSRTEDTTLVLVVGEGLIGAAVSRRLRHRPLIEEQHTAVDWTNPDFEAYVRQLAPTKKPTSVEIVWSAGVFGMTSTIEVGALSASFEKNLRAIINESQRLGPVRLHLVSSAGALGCPSGDRRFETLESPYKAIKAAEELIVARQDIPVHMYRVTSVFGAKSSSGRSGLIGALLTNALRREETALFARTTTMRNYIHADDVGEAIVRSVLSPPQPHPTTMALIAARRSHPMNEVVATAEQILRRPVPVSYRPPRNHHDMVFSPRAVSTLVPQRSLATGMRMLHDTLVSA